MRRAALTAVALVGVCLLLFPTAGSQAGQEPVSTADLELSPTTSSNSDYAVQTGGSMRLDFTQTTEDGTKIGVNREAVTRFDRVFRVQYTGSPTATVWFETPVSGVEFYHGADPGQTIESKETGVTLEGGEEVRVGVLIDTRGAAEEIEQFDRFFIVVTSDSGGSDFEQVPVDTSGPSGGDSAPGSPEDSGGDQAGDGGGDQAGDNGGDGTGDGGGDQTGDDGGDQAGDDDGDGTGDGGGDGTPPDVAGPADVPEPSPESDAEDGTGVGEDSEPGAGAEAAGSVTELGESFQSGQAAIGGLNWLLVLVVGLVLGVGTASAVRRAL